MCTTRRPALVLLAAAALLAAVRRRRRRRPRPAPRPPTTTAPSASTSAADAPERIVSLSPTATEMLFAIGAGDQVVAVDDQSTSPTRCPTTDLSGYEPNVEAIAAYEPDLVVLSGGPRRPRDRARGHRRRRARRCRPP